MGQKHLYDYFFSSMILWSWKLQKLIYQRTKWVIFCCQTSQMQNKPNSVTALLLERWVPIRDIDNMTVGVGLKTDNNSGSTRFFVFNLEGGGGNKWAKCMWREQKSKNIAENGRFCHSIFQTRGGWGREVNWGPLVPPLDNNDLFHCWLNDHVTDWTSVK